VQYIIFDGESTTNFYPLTYTKPAFDLYLGTKTLLDNLVEKLSLKKYDLMVQPHLKEITCNIHNTTINPHTSEEDIVFINGRLILNQETQNLLQMNEHFTALSNGELALAKLGKKASNNLLQGEKTLKNLESGLKSYDLSTFSLIRYPWELIDRNPLAIEEQFKMTLKGEVPDLTNCEVLGPNNNLKFEGNVLVESNVLFDLRKGPVLISDGAEIQSNTRIEGPAYIGEKTQIRSAQIRSGTSIGHHCKISGEVECSIISSYSNKAHDGFLGHSYVGEWVNIGAGTSNSDLKNTYGVIKMNVGNVEVNTASNKIGCFISDYVKTSIGCFIYTGKRIGVASHIHGYVTEDVPSFTIHAKSLTGKSFELHKNSAIETQKRIMKRRNRNQTSYEKDLLNQVFEMTQDERYIAGVLKTDFSM
jgi:UDP-N-acetylglucosamine diphosphorylase/glucosamine-1-phosphate N-acetyltransferase|tara:strand:- start:2811 stop:4064 length:1254 start_codon:yes stop_codon:yes gene_type:complete